MEIAIHLNTNKGKGRVTDRYLINASKSNESSMNSTISVSSSRQTPSQQAAVLLRRGKRDKEISRILAGDGPTIVKTKVVTAVTSSSTNLMARKKKNQRQKYQQHHQQQQHQQQLYKKRNETNQSQHSKIIQVLLPSIIGMILLGGAIFMKYSNFRGRPMTCGIDLGTTNSVICIQEQSTGLFTSSSSTSSTTATNTGNNKNSKKKNDHLVIRCIADPRTGSPVIPSVVSFLDEHERRMILSSESSPSLNTTTSYRNKKTNQKNKKEYTISIQPDTDHVLVGYDGKRRIDTHPHHTIYHAKRVLGRNTYDPAIQTLRNEVEFTIVNRTTSTTATNNTSMENSNNNNNNEDEDDEGVEFHVPDTPIPITPQMVGTYIIHYMVQMTYNVLGHTSIKSAIICVPAKFNQRQRMETIQIYTAAGIKVTRILEEPTAAALAYGLHHKNHIDYILVYDFGGGTLDISLLHVSDGYVDVIGSDGDDNLGGTDFDHSIAQYLLYERPLIINNDENNIDDGSRRTGILLVQTVHSILKQIQEQQQKVSTDENEDIGSSSVAVDLEDTLLKHCPKLHTIPLCTISSFHTLSEQLKINLSDGYSTDETIVSVSAQCMYISDQLQFNPWTIDTFCSALVPYTLTLNTLEFNTIVQPLFDRSVLPIERLLKDMNMNPLKDIQEIVMVGGTTRMPQIRTLIQNYFPNSQLNIDIDPDLTVAYGAASVID